MPTRRMSRSQSRKYLSSTRCINPGDPGCGPRARAERWTKRDQRELDEYSKMKEKERFGKKIGELPQIAKRRVIGEGKEPGPSYQKPASFELEKKTSSTAKRGSKVKKAKMGGVAKKKSTSVKAKYGIAKKASKKGGKK